MGDCGTRPVVAPLSQFRDTTCTGAAVPGSSVIMSGVGANRTATFTPSTSAASVVLCLRRDGRPGAPVGPPFPIVALTYSIAHPSEPAVGVRVNVSLSGVSDFDADDNVTLRKTSCSGAEVTDDGLGVVSGEGASRDLIVTPLEAFASVRVCLERGSRAAALVGPAIPIVTLTYALTPVEAAQVRFVLLTPPKNGLQPPVMRPPPPPPRGLNRNAPRPCPRRRRWNGRCPISLQDRQCSPLPPPKRWTPSPPAQTTSPK